MSQPGGLRDTIRSAAVEIDRQMLATFAETWAEAVTVDFTAALSALEIEAAVADPIVDGSLRIAAVEAAIGAAGIFGETDQAAINRLAADFAAAGREAVRKRLANLARLARTEGTA